MLRTLLFFICCVCISATISSHQNWKLVQNDKCGKNIQLDDRIIGGRKASLGQYPWIARLGVSMAFVGIFVTYGWEGALINERYVVTAAHCVADEPLLYLSVVRLGENYASSDHDCSNTLCAPPVQDFKPEAMIVHKLYTKEKYGHDIALIRLDRPAVLNDFVVPICLPFGQLMDKNFTSQPMEVAGWGVTNSSTGSTSNDILFIHIDMLPLEICEIFFRKSTTVGPGQICLGGQKNIDTCTGDSGGPLMKAESVDGPPKYFLFGVVSFGAKKCGSGPAIYSDVRYYLPWILDNMKP